MGLVLTVLLADLLAGRRAAGNSGAGSDGGRCGFRGGGPSGNGFRGDGDNGKPKSKVRAAGGGARLGAQYNKHLPDVSLLDRENSRTLLVGTFLPTLHGHVFCKNWHLCGVLWEECDYKKLHVYNPLGVATTIDRLQKSGLGGMTWVPAA